MSRFENSGPTSETQALAPVVFDKRFIGKVLPIIGEMIANNERAVALSQYAHAGPHCRWSGLETEERSVT
ncbi:MAG: hypothetical protein QGH15_07705 [Kiritimatiellia bacterium]|jgi:hypothetical protein|nr:hypothetical protein [Kiritimatiellia bacterium]